MEEYWTTTAGLNQYALQRGSIMTQNKYTVWYKQTELFTTDDKELAENACDVLADVYDPDGTTGNVWLSEPQVTV